MPHGNLYEYMQKYNIRFGPVLRQICEAVDFLHSYGIVHRDIKPQNFLIKIVKLEEGTSMVVKLTDFGTALTVNTTPDLMEYQDDKDVGTIAYLAPERFEWPEGMLAKNRTMDEWAIGYTYAY
ncbi:kinase-like protein [Fomitiporia mediterranea MF3/22]|uniref:kinase-like protein n=1 Tax=Fomitiporia mediterranea (strain MF3/22) TaxID=694068 RepID=UPI0004408248|nr:kinase-like protein [Fomitiporia mediterranea MF3/22]EJD04910.1 kinase-like protein [Fomitiporia mediterranea MF3/22]